MAMDTNSKLPDLVTARNQQHVEYLKARHNILIARARMGAQDAIDTLKREYLDPRYAPPVPNAQVKLP